MTQRSYKNKKVVTLESFFLNINTAMIIFKMPYEIIVNINHKSETKMNNSHEKILKGTLSEI